MPTEEAGQPGRESRAGESPNSVPDWSPAEVIRISLLPLLPLLLFLSRRCCFNRSTVVQTVNHVGSRRRRGPARTLDRPRPLNLVLQAHSRRPDALHRAVDDDPPARRQHGLPQPRPAVQPGPVHQRHLDLGQGLARGRTQGLGGQARQEARQEGRQEGRQGQGKAAGGARRCCCRRLRAGACGCC